VKNPRLLSALSCLSMALLPLMTPVPAGAAEAEEPDASEAVPAPGPVGGAEEETEDRPPPVGVTGIELKELEEDYEPRKKRFILPPYYSEESERVSFRTVLPLFFQRERTGEGARKDLGLLPFYWRYREGEASADVYFPLYWRFRDPEFETDIVLQTYYNRGASGFNFGIGPLLFLGKDEKAGSSYQVVPPLFWNFKDKDGGFTLAGIYYDHRDKGDYDRGVPPLVFAGRNRDKTYLAVLPPLFWHFADEVNYKTTTVLPPLFFRTRETGWSAGLLPHLYLARDEHWARTLVTPLYYGSRWGDGRSHYIPPLLTYYRHSPTLSQGGVAIFYHWYESEGDYLRMYSPLLWNWGNDRSDERSWLVPPVLYRHDSPVADDTMIGLVYWNFHEHHRERTFAIAPLFAHNWSLFERRWRTWIAPTFDFGVSPEGYHARLHPLFYLGKGKRDNHLVIAPIFWRLVDEEDRNTVVFPLWWNFRDLEHDSLDRTFFPLWWQFEDYRRSKYRRAVFPLFWDFKDSKKKERTVVLAPFYWRDRDPERTVTGVLNVIHNKGEIKNNPFWTFQIFPLVSLGKPPAPEGAYWSFLWGMAGWRRQGSTRELKLFWIPIDLSDDE